MEAAVPVGLDADSERWVRLLTQRDSGALDELHDLLLRAARFEIGRRRAAMPHLRGGDFDDLAHQSADDALVAVLRKLSDFRGDSRFTTWAYKFALLEAAVSLRRRAWQGREVPLAAEGWETLMAGGETPAGASETTEILSALREGIAERLTPRQRDVLVALVLNGVPIDVLAERMGTTRGALYKVLHDARRSLRVHLEEGGLR